MATPVRVVAYINGLRIYPRAVSVSSSAGDLASFALDVPAVREWALLTPRSHVAVFFSDPVTRRWRMLCEGEYFGWNYEKSGDGQVSRRLTCSMVHGSWKTARYANIAGMLSQGAAQPTQDSSLVNAQLSASVSGQRIPTTATGNVDPLLVPASLSALIDQTTGTDTRFSAFLTRFIEAALNQSPVDAFYMYARKMLSKMVTLEDKELGFVFDQARMKDVLKNGVNAMGFGPDTPMDTIIQSYEAVAFYRHVAILAPPFYAPRSASGLITPMIPEVFFMPYLYNVVPPACNVIFRDQIASLTGSIDFRTQPTRVVTKLQLEPVANGIPKFYMVNGDGAQDPLASWQNRETPPGVTVTHEFLSSDELNRGVNVEFQSMAMERIVGSDLNNPNRASFESYMDQATRHQFDVSKGAPVQRTINLSFNPYIVPGFPAIVDDAGSPIYGMVAAISHTLTAEGTQMTSVVLTHVRELFVISGQNRTPFPPVYLNGLYRPESIAETYTKIFGNNLFGGHAAMLPQSDILSSVDNALSGNRKSYLAASRTDIDALAAKVIPVPTYTKEGLLVSVSSPSVWANVRAQPADTQAMAQRYQFRPGTSLSDFISMHVLQVDDLSSVDDATKEPPKDLAPTRTSEGGHRLFGAPSGLRYRGRDGKPNTVQSDIQQPTDGFGLYEPFVDTKRSNSIISDERQRLTRTIQAALDRGASMI